MLIWIVITLASEIGWWCDCENFQKTIHDNSPKPIVPCTWCILVNLKIFSPFIQIAIQFSFPLELSLLPFPRLTWVWRMCFRFTTSWRNPVAEGSCHTTEILVSILSGPLFPYANSPPRLWAHLAVGALPTLESRVGCPFYQTNREL